MSFPLLGMLAWNLVVYVLLLGEAAFGAPKELHKSRPLTRWLVGLITRRRLAASSDAPGSVTEWLYRGLNGFVTDWFRLAAPLYGARARRLLHLAAAALATGTIGGMYVRGLGLEYLAGWESTFLNEHSVRTLLGIILAPAASLSGLDLPSAEHLALLRWPEHQGENAAPWIHLYAVTTALFIVIPRLLLAAGAHCSLQRWRQHFPLPLDGDAYFGRLLNAGRQQSAEIVQVISYSFELNVRRKEVLSVFLYELFGLNANLRFQPALIYGTEDDYLTRPTEKADESPRWLFLLFNLASTPEQENHGRLISGCMQLVGSGKGPLFVLVEESGYRERLGDDPGWLPRVEERRQTWRRLTRPMGINVIFLDLLNPEPERWLAETRAIMTGIRPEQRVT